MSRSREPVCESGAVPTGSAKSKMAKTPLRLNEIVDGDALRESLTGLTSQANGNGSSQGVRAQVLQLLKSTIAEGHSRAEQMLMQDGSGSLCAARISHLMDEVIRRLYDFAS